MYRNNISLSKGKANLASLNTKKHEHMRHNAVPQPSSAILGRKQLPYARTVRLKNLERSPVPLRVPQSDTYIDDCMPYAVCFMLTTPDSALS